LQFIANLCLENGLPAVLRGCERGCH
jgi:hypothetical protein